MTTLTDARQIQFLQNQYDANGRVYKQIQVDGTFFTFTYQTDSNNNVTQTNVTDPNGISRQVSFFPPNLYVSGFNSGGYISKDILAVGLPEQQTYVYQRHSANFLKNII